MNTHQRHGGAVLLISSLLLIVATFVEQPLLGHPTTDGGLFWTYLVTFGLASIGYAIAGALLAERGSIAGSSVLGRLGLLGFGIFWLVSQVLYLIGTYLTPSDAVLAVSLVFAILMIIALLVGSIVVLVKKIATPLARWTLLVAAILSAVTGGAAGALSSPIAITVLHLISAAGLAAAGLTYLIDRTARSAA